jgi:hypothetical protein
MGMTRRLAGIVIFAIGVFLLYRVFAASSAYVDRGASLSDYLFESPPTGFIQLLGASMMTAGGILSALKVFGGGILGLIGSLIIALLGALLLMQSSLITDGLDEALYAAAGVLLSILILSFKRN